MTKKPIKHMSPCLARRLFSGEAPYTAFKSDGCTCAPDRAINGADLREACRWHDFAYQIGGCESDRKKADRHFLRNLKVSGCPFFTRHFYFRRVRFWGVLAFNYWTRRPSFREWLALLVSRHTEASE
tara:strand:- start:19302 stop:19682 length:381 start_codon:yes stop_codon:yes gene_type:complete